MSGLDSLIRLHRWKLEEKRRALAELESLMDDLRTRASDLEPVPAPAINCVEREIVAHHHSRGIEEITAAPSALSSREQLGTQGDEIGRQPQLAVGESGAGRAIAQVQLTRRVSLLSRRQ